MADIFGREQVDYTHIAALQRAGVYRQHQQALTATTGHPPHNFRALDAGGKRDMTQRDANAQALGFVTTNLQTVMSVIDEILYRDYRLDDLLPIRRDIPEGAQTYYYRIKDGAAVGRFIANDGNDAATAHVSLRQVPYNMHYAGIAPEWTVNDVREAQLTGIALDAEVLETGTTACLDHIERVGLVGDTDRNLIGLTNQPLTGNNAVKRETASETFANSTAEQIRVLINNQITGIIKDTAEVFGTKISKPLSIYLPISQWERLVTLPFGDNSDRTLWTYLRSQNAWTQYTGHQLRLQPLTELEDAGTGDSGRMILFINDLMVAEMAISIFPRALNPVDMGFSLKVPMEYKLSGFHMKRPAGLKYVDGV